MSFDYYAYLAEDKVGPKQVNECGLASGFVDGCTTWFCQDKPQGNKTLDPKNKARKCYINRASKLELNLPQGIKFEPDFSNLPDSNWCGIEVSFTLQSPWYSKDDRAFHIMDNPIRKDRVFGVPFMPAASWKGLLRWAYGMNHGLIGPNIESDKKKIETLRKEIVHLFGNEKGEKKHFRSGTLVFYPTWFNKVGFEVINPHDRARRTALSPFITKSFRLVQKERYGCSTHPCREKSKTIKSRPPTSSILSLTASKRFLKPTAFPPNAPPDGAWRRLTSGRGL